MDTQDKISIDSVDRLIDARAPVPDSRALEQRIIAETEDVSQQQTLVVKLAQFRHWQLAPLAIAASIALALYIWVPSFEYPVEAVPGSESLLTIQELELQELLLLQDELMFAQL